MGQFIASRSVPAQPCAAVQVAKTIVLIADQLLDEVCTHVIHENLQV